MFVACNIFARLLLGSFCVAFVACSQVLHGSELVSFELDVQPILTKAGCNSGACHGKQRGQNGFQLSLLGFDAEYDFEAITRGGRGRRIFPASPERSLLLDKAIAVLPHGGGKRFELDSSQYAILKAWIAQGTPRISTDEPRLERIELTQDAFLLEPRAQDGLATFAFYSDGTSRDVTGMTDYQSNEPVVVAVDATGRMKAGELPGETAIMARYMNHICVANVVIPNNSNLDSQAFESLARHNFIDELVYRKLAKTGVFPSEDAADAEFLRRAYTDLIGRVPTPIEARQFLDTQSKNKREYLVDELLDRPEYVDHWANQWVDLLRPNPYRVGIKAVLNYDDWIREQFRENASYDVLVHKLVTAKGSTWRNGSVTLYRDRRSPDEMATLVSQLFLGVRLECAKCHHHPFEKWSQDDFYQFAAYFGRVAHKGTGLSPPISGGEETVFVSASGSVKHPNTGQVMDPKPLFGEAPVGPDEDPREALARWITSPNNSYFAKVQVNRIWSVLMGRGLVEPVDDLRSTNPPSNPELLDALADYFREVGFDQKQLIKTIVLSRVYGLSSQPNQTNIADRLNYSRHYRHRLRAEVLLDAVADITETPSQMRGVPPGSRSNQVWTHRVDSLFLDTFGRPDANQDPPCERTSDSTVTQALHLMNSKELDQRIRSDTGRAGRLAKSALNPQKIVVDLYLAIYSRYPTAEEADYAVSLFGSDGTARHEIIQDLMWALMNSPEFVVQN